MRRRLGAYLCSHGVALQIALHELALKMGVNAASQYVICFGRKLAHRPWLMRNEMLSQIAAFPMNASSQHRQQPRAPLTLPCE